MNQVWTTLKHYFFCMQACYTLIEHLKFKYWLQLVTAQQLVVTGRLLDIYYNRITSTTLSAQERPVNTRQCSQRCTTQDVTTSIDYDRGNQNHSGSVTLIFNYICRVYRYIHAVMYAIVPFTLYKYRFPFSTLDHMLLKLISE